jgi:predicted ATPase/DNA-binding winged helix-turn-helix (wHTH) protein
MVARSSGLSRDGPTLLPMPPASGKATYAYMDWVIDLARRELRLRGSMVPIGGRAFEIIEVLIGQAGRVVSKTDIMARLWPGAFVEENTLQVHISAVRKALGADRGLLDTAPGRGYVLRGTWVLVETPVQAPPLGVVPLQAISPPSHNLPLAGSDLIGRASAIQQLLDAVSAYRVVTLTGPGGIGKTRLAQEVARILLSQFRGDIRFVDLATLADPKLVHAAVAAALGLELGGVEVTASAVARALGGRKLLMLLDNCEHVIDTAAELAEAVIRTCPDVSIMATSRETLRIEGEHCYRVPPLQVPPVQQQTAQELVRHSAVQFVMTRMQSLRGDAAPNHRELSAIAALCRRLDGIPLALEFAAARIAALGAETVLSRLDERFQLLIGGQRTALPKHQTLLATLDWSYQLLPEPERRLLRVLSVFPAGFTLEAACFVAQESGDMGHSVMDGIANLVTKSLISFDESEASPRWRLLETTRAYASDRLRECGEADAASERHAAYFRDLIPSASAARLTTQDLTRYGREIDNVRAALAWAFSAGGRPAIAISLTAAYVPVWLQLLLVVECAENIERALSALSPEIGFDASLIAQLHINLGFALLNTAGLAQKTASVLTTGLALAERLNDPALQLRATWAIWSLHLNVGRYREARAAAARLLDIAHRTGNCDDILVGHRLLGAALHFLGHQPEARQHLDRVLEGLPAESGQDQPMWFLVDQRVVTRAMLARVLLLQGCLDQALAASQRCLQEALAAGDKLSICYALRNALCPVTLTIGDVEGAARAVDQLVDLVTRNGMVFWLSWATCLKGQLQVRRGLFAEGTALLRTGIDARVQAGWMMRNPEFIGTLAEGLAGSGQHDAALIAIDEALAQSERDSQLWCFADLLRIKGDVLLQLAAARHFAAAETCLALAIQHAQAQGALLWELRAALSLARLRVTQGRHGEAHAALAAVYQRFEEGHDTPALQTAQLFLAEIARP